MPVLFLPSCRLPGSSCPSPQPWSQPAFSHGLVTCTASLTHSLIPEHTFILCVRLSPGVGSSGREVGRKNQFEVRLPEALAKEQAGVSWQARALVMTGMEAAISLRGRQGSETAWDLKPHAQASSWGRGPSRFNWRYDLPTFNSLFFCCYLHKSSVYALPSGSIFRSKTVFNMRP